MSGMQIFVKTFKAEPLPAGSGLRPVWKAPAGTEAMFMAGEVDGFAAATEELELIDGLPAGVNIPAELLDVIAMAKEVEAWLDTARRVRSWAETEGHGLASWTDAEAESPLITVPPELSRDDLPGGVVRWVLHSDEIGPLVRRLLGADGDA